MTSNQNGSEQRLPGFEGSHDEDIRLEGDRTEENMIAYQSIGKVLFDNDDECIQLTLC
ncbi:MAG: hypothetical protein M1554_01430 [Patescibacteria group bacterium]|nr:hypothetical protein [Patescibacteria group bacterium]